jgi:hypothetical protein
MQWADFHRQNGHFEKHKWAKRRKRKLVNFRHAGPPNHAPGLSRSLLNFARVTAPIYSYSSEGSVTIESQPSNGMPSRVSPVTQASVSPKAISVSSVR